MMTAVILRRMRKMNDQTRTMEMVIGMPRTMKSSYRRKRRINHVVSKLKRRRWQGN